MPATNRVAVHGSFQDGALTQIAGVDVSRLTRVECAALFAETKSLEGRLLARLLTSEESAARESSGDGDKLLDVNQAAEMLSVSRQWIYRNGRNLNLVVELGKGTIRYSQAAILAYVRKSTAKSHARKQQKMAQPL
jgi:predicted DNA-binding transcriptional regulator AlpA